jgi:hypothetical protein
MCLEAAFFPFQVREMKLAPAHAIRSDAVIHLLGVLKAVRQAVVKPVAVVEAHEGTPFVVRRFVAD